MAPSRILPLVALCLGGPLYAQVPTPTPTPPSGGQTIQLTALEATTERADAQKLKRDPKGLETGESVRERFETASDALTSVLAIVANVNQVLSFTAMEQALSAGTNPWSDEQFRNTYDKVDGWLTPLGLALAGASSLLPQANQRQNGAAAFIGLSGIARFLGARFGQQSGAKFEQKAAFVEFSRRAYDDLRDRYSTTNEYIQANKSLLADIETFRSGTFSAAAKDTSSEKKKAALVSAGAFLTRLDLVMTQIPAMLQLYESTVSRYCPQAITQAVKDPNNLGGLECRSQLPGQAAPFVLVGDAKQYILQAAVQLAELRANLKAADQVRTLTPKLRAALAGQ